MTLDTRNCSTFAIIKHLLFPKLTIIFAIILLTFTIGAFVGVNIYKSSCQVYGYSATDKWRECAL